jgi:hypothetical protein
MLKLLRQCRALALTLLLAAPGLGGTWLSLAHPCPVDMPWLAEAPSEHGGQSSHGHGDTSSGSTTSCNCVGACQSAAATLAPVIAGPKILPVGAGWDASPSTPDSEVPVQLRLRRHPPATAPPLA